MVNVNPFGAIVVVIGLLGAIWPYRVARSQEALDAIGSTRNVSEVEPAGWMITLTRIVGIVAIAAGFMILFGIISI